MKMHTGTGTPHKPKPHVIYYLRLFCVEWCNLATRMVDVTVPPFNQGLACSADRSFSEKLEFCSL